MPSSAQLVRPASHAQLATQLVGLTTFGQVDGVETELLPRAILTGADIAPDRGVIEATLGQDFASLRRKSQTIFRAEARLSVELEGVHGAHLLVLRLPEVLAERKAGFPHLCEQITHSDTLLLLKEAEAGVGTVFTYTHRVEAPVDGLTRMGELDAQVVAPPRKDTVDSAHGENLDEDDLGLEQEDRGALLCIGPLREQTFHLRSPVCHDDLRSLIELRIVKEGITPSLGDDAVGFLIQHYIIHLFNVKVKCTKVTKKRLGIASFFGVF